MTPDLVIAAVRLGVASPSLLIVPTGLLAFSVPLVQAVVRSSESPNF
jgi:hypothetical protein